MRFQITFNRTGRQKMLPIDYQYYISAWIYKVIDKTDKNFADFLHSQGYSDGTKKFKLFNYSPLNFGRPIMWKEKSLFEIKTNIITLRVSFMLNETAEKFILGLFNQQHTYIGDRFNGLDLIVEQVERLPDNEINKTIQYRATSPVVISWQNNEDKYAKYLSPEDIRYSDLLKNHLINKYSTVPNVTKLPETFDFKFTLKNEPRSKLITIKPYTREQSKIRGFIYNFELTAPTEIHKLILSCGSGEKNSMGFGWCETENKKIKI